MSRSVRRVRIAMRIAWSAVVSCAIAIAPVCARADEAAAEAMFDEGLRRMKEGHVDEACASFERAVDLAGGNAIGGLLLLGECREKQGRTASAWAAYRRAFAAAQQQGDRREAKAREAVARLEPSLARLVVRVAPELAARGDLEIVRGGAVLPREAWGVAMPVDPGSVAIVAKLPGAAPHTIEVAVAAKPATYEALVAPWFAAPSSQTSERAAEGGIGALGVAGVVIGGAGVLALSAGIGVGAFARTRYTSAIADPENACSDGQCNARGKSAVDAARSLGDAGTVTGIAGGVLAGVGATLLVVDLVGRRATRASAREDLRVRIAPWAVRLEGRF